MPQSLLFHGYNILMSTNAKNTLILETVFAEAKLFLIVYTEDFIMRNCSQLSPNTQKGLDLSKNYKET